MGRSYWFECVKCGYRAKVSGREDRGLNCFVQTIVCRDCRELYDAVTRVRIMQPARVVAAGAPAGPRRMDAANQGWSPDRPPSFQSVMNRLLYLGVGRSRWVHFRLRCPVSTFHRVESWTDPAKCPKCGLPLEKNVLPYRIWD
jgi:hypothetical protein